MDTLLEQATPPEPRTEAGQHLWNRLAEPEDYAWGNGIRDSIIAIEQEAVIAYDPIVKAVRWNSTDPIAQCDDGTHHVLELARNVIEARPEHGTCDHCGQLAPCTERRIAVAFVEVMEAALAAVESSPEREGGE